MSDRSSLFCQQCNKRLKASKKLTSKALHCPLCGAVLKTASDADASQNPEKQTSSLPISQNVLIAIGVVVALFAAIVFIVVRSGDAEESDDPLQVAEVESLEPTLNETTQPEATAPESLADASEANTPSPTPFLESELAYQFKLTAAYPDRQYEWNGEIMLGLLPDRPVTLATGIAIPNRWIVVPLTMIKDAESIQVIHQGTNYDAEVRRKLTKLGWATLQIDRREKFPSPMADRANRLARDAKGLRVVYLNETGMPQVRAGLSVTGGTDDWQYQIPPLPRTALGGIVLHDSGRIAGFVSSISANRSVVVPWFKIGSGWGAGGGAGIFDYDNPLPDELVESPERFGDNLVQVAVRQLESRKTNPPVLFQSSVRRVSSTPKEDDLVPTSVQNSSQDDFRLTRAPSGMLDLTPTSSRKPAKPRWLPYGLGLPIDLSVMPINSAGARRWTTEESVRVHYGRGTGIAHPEGNDRQGFTTCAGKCSYFVVEETGSRLQLTREIERRNNAQLPIQISQSGKENVTLDLVSGFVRERTYDGELTQALPGASPITIKIHYELNLMRSPESEQAPRYWR